ncbi:hypothetical protein DFQ26_007358 [Actinomortierella ambigua]|nr:hypothetical protein DFQ26_007358 [Actinomortierella ambigua]
MTNWAHVKIPATPTPNLILVTNISATASEKTVKDFFLFCGKISEFELQKDGDRQTALVLFERESAAKTACMLTNAMIVDTQITVKPYFEETADTNGEPSQENKPKAPMYAEMLAAGYTLSDSIIEKGLELDAKYGFKDRINSYLSYAKAQAQAFDEKYRVSVKAQEIDSKYHVQDRVNATVAQGVELSHQALQSPTGQKVQGMAAQLKEQVAAVHYEARRIADEKKAKTPASAATSDDEKTA